MKPTIAFLQRLFPFGVLFWVALSLPGQQPPTAQLVIAIKTGDDLAVVAAWAPDGQHLAYGTEKKVPRRKSPLSVGDEVYSYPGEVWISDLVNEPKRILRHDFLRSAEGDFFSFSVERLAWSPDGQKLAVEITDEKGTPATFLITTEGKRVKLGSSPANSLLGYGAGWLADNESLGLLNEVVKPRLLHQVSLVRVAGGRVIPLFGEKTFAAIAWLPKAHKVVLVESDPEFTRTPRLAVGDLESGELTVLDELTAGYLGGLRATPDETTVSYFVGQAKLAVRALRRDAPIEYWPIPVGRYEWAGPRRVLLFIEPEERGRRTGWLTFYDPAQQKKQRLLPDERIQDFWVAPDGEQVAVLTVGLKPVLKVYRLDFPTTP